MQPLIKNLIIWIITYTVSFTYYAKVALKMIFIKIGKCKNTYVVDERSGYPNQFTFLKIVNHFKKYLHFS